MSKLQKMMSTLREHWPIAADELKRLSTKNITLTAKLAQYRASMPTCEEHKPVGGARGGCLICACIKYSYTLSRIDYACGSPNEQIVSGYDVHCDEEEVVKNVRALADKLAAAELALLEAQCKNEALWKWLDGNAEHVPTCGHGAESGCTCGLSDLIYNNPDTSALSAHERRVCGEPVAEVISVDPITGIAKVQMAHQVNGYLIPKIGTKLCIAPTFTTAATTKGQSDVL